MQTVIQSEIFNICKLLQNFTCADNSIETIYDRLDFILSEIESSLTVDDIVAMIEVTNG